MLSTLLVVACTGPAPGPSTPSATTASTSSTAGTGADTGPSGTASTGLTGLTGDTATAAGSPCVDLITNWGLIPLDGGSPNRQLNVAHAPDGDSLWVTWTENLPNTMGFDDDPAVFGGRFRCDGTWAVGPTQLGGAPLDVHTDTSVAVGSAGALFAWSGFHRRGGAIEFTDTFTALLAIDGTVLAAPDWLELTLFGAPYLDDCEEPTVRTLATGGFGLVAMCDDPSTQRNRTVFQELDDAGVLVGDGLVVQPIGPSQTHPDIAATDPPTVAWNESLGVVITPVGGTKVEQFDGLDYDIEAAPDGLWRAWDANPSPSIHVEAPSGVQTTLGTKGAFEDEPSIGVGRDRVAVAWLHHLGGFGSARIQVASFDRSGTWLDQRELLAEDGHNDGAVEVSHVGDDVFFVAWEHGPVSDTRIYGQFVDLR